METKFKQPAEQLDYPVKFDKWLPDGDTITSGDATLDIVGELVIESIGITDQTVTVWVSGGVDGKTYKVTVLAATAGGRIVEEDFKIRVKEI